MDLINDVIQNISVSEGGFGVRSFRSPWSIAVGKNQFVMVHIVLKGEAWIQLEEKGTPIHLKPGHLVLLPHGHRHWMRSSTKVSLAKAVKNQCGFRGTQEKGETTLICGYLIVESLKESPFYVQLPRIFELKKSETGKWLKATIKLLQNFQHGPGSISLMDQLAGALFTQVLMQYFNSSSFEKTNWQQYSSDSQIAKALHQIHNNTKLHWTIDLLAKECSMSRTSFANKFKTLVGETPMHYLIRWRMELAAKMLRSQAVTIQEICERVGYQSESTFSKAFKRQTGSSPTAYRKETAFVGRKSLKGFFKNL